MMGGGLYILRALGVGPAWIGKFLRGQFRDKKLVGLGAGRKFTTIQLGTDVGSENRASTIRRFGPITLRSPQGFGQLA
jgi:hypothetical protein